MKTSKISRTMDKGILTTVFASVTKMPIEIRERICLACGWSIPTFYRKIREDQPLSPALRKTIITIIRAHLKKQLGELERTAKVN